MGVVLLGSSRLYAFVKKLSMIYTPSERIERVVLLLAVIVVLLDVLIWRP